MYLNLSIQDFQGTVINVHVPGQVGIVLRLHFSHPTLYPGSLFPPDFNDRERVSRIGEHEIEMVCPLHRQKNKIRSITKNKYWYDTVRIH